MTPEERAARAIAVIDSNLGMISEGGLLSFHRFAATTIADEIRQAVEEATGPEFLEDCAEHYQRGWIAAKLDGVADEREAMTLEERDSVLEECCVRLPEVSIAALLSAPCLWCGYNGAGYYQPGTHAARCRWRSVGGLAGRSKEISNHGEGRPMTPEERTAREIRALREAATPYERGRLTGAADERERAAKMADEWAEAYSGWFTDFAAALREEKS